MEDKVRCLLTAAGTDGAAALPAADRLIDALDELLMDEGLIS
jgi:hypothetical protein